MQWKLKNLKSKLTYSKKTLLPKAKARIIRAKGAVRQ